MSAFNNEEVVTSAREQIDNDIDSLIESARALKTKRNSLATISRLPPEMLSKIFAFVIGTSHSEFTSGSLEWVKCTSHVCQHWRAVALACPSLWGRVVFIKPRWAEEMLKRSKMAPLVVRADLTYMTPKMLDTVQSAMKHLPHTRELHISAMKLPMEKILANAMFLDAPLLESLCLSNPRFGYASDLNYTLPECGIFNGATRLRRLELTKCNLSWDSPLLTGLTHLKLHDFRSLLPTMSQMLDALERMPNLESLDLEDCLPTLPDATTTPPQPDRIVNLPHLSRIRLSSQILECANLLNHLCYSSSTSLRLNCKATDATYHEISSLIPALSNVRKNIREGNEKPIRCLTIEGITTSCLRLQTWPYNNGPRNAPSRPSSRVELELSWRHYGRGTMERVVSELCHALPLTHLDTLHVYDIDLPLTKWLRAFGGLSRLKNIHVRGPAACGLIEALHLVEECESKRNLRKTKAVLSAGVFFPGLKKLVLERAHFLDEDVDFLDLDELCNCLMQRYECKAEIRELQLIDCYHLSGREVELIRQIVVDVEWDEVEQGFSDQYSDEDEFSDGPYGSYDSDEDDIQFLNPHYFGYMLDG